MAGFQITIIGLGVTGTSLGLALKKAARDLRVVGHDREPATAAAARQAGAVDRTDWNLPSACRGAGIVILALPLAAIRDTLSVIGPDLPKGCLVTDTAPLKKPVLAWAREMLPPHLGFVGGDPVGARNRATTPVAGLFEGTTYCLCPDLSTPPEGIDRAADLAVAVGATPRFLDADEHDGLVALLDQLPFILALATLRSAGGEAVWRELVQLGGGRFEQLMAALGDNPATTLEASAANAANLDRWLDHTQQALDDARALLGATPEARQQVLERLAELRSDWARRGEEAAVPRPELGLNLRRLFWFR
jgi:prephenate dehydrogenase